MAILYDPNIKQESGLLPGYCRHCNTVTPAVLLSGWQEQDAQIAKERGPVDGWFHTGCPGRGHLKSS